MQTSGKLILGTVQFGLDYGINNRAGKPSEASVRAILDLAASRGISILDTAEAYGDAHDRIGNYHKTSAHRFSVITKFSAGRKDLPPDLYDRVTRDIETLHVDRLYAYMFHSFADYTKHFAENEKALRRLKEEKLTGRIGVSVYTNEECERVIEDGHIDLVQLPFNVLDNIRQRGEVIKKARQRGIEIHSRSAFLQGLFFRGAEQLPAKLKPLAPYLKQLEELAAQNNISIGRLALAYAVQSPVDKVIIGVDSTEQLEANLDDIAAALPENIISAADRINVARAELLNPSNWPSVKVLAITQARTGSTRLPAKVLKEVNGKTLLKIHLGRILRSARIDQLVVATTTEPGDTAIAEIAGQMGLPVHRGSVNDVLDRFYGAAVAYRPQWVVRLTADCPLIDPALIDEVIDAAERSGADYCSNTLDPTFPDGMDVEVFRYDALVKAHREATSVSDREHVTPYIYRNSDLRGGEIFSALNFSGEQNFGHVRLTVDEPADFQVISRLIEALGTDKDWRAYADLYLSTRDIRAMNEKINRNEGYQ